MSEQKQKQGHWERPSESELILTTPYGGTWSFMLTDHRTRELALFGEHHAEPFEDRRVSAVVSQELALALRDALVDWYGPGENYERNEEAEAHEVLDRVNELLDDSDWTDEGLVDTLWELLGKKKKHTVGDALNELPVRSVVKFDCDVHARYTLTRKGWKDVANDFPLADDFLSSPADEYPFQVKYNPEED